MAKKARRTIHRSTTGTKLYAVRDAQGRFKDIQTYSGRTERHQAEGESGGAAPKERHLYERLTRRTRRRWSAGTRRRLRSVSPSEP